MTTRIAVAVRVVLLSALLLVSLIAWLLATGCTAGVAIDDADGTPALAGSDPFARIGSDGPRFPALEIEGDLSFGRVAGC